MGTEQNVLCFFLYFREKRGTPKREEPKKTPAMQERFQLNKESILSDIAPIALSSLPSSALFFLAFYAIIVLFVILIYFTYLNSLFPIK